MSRGAHPDAKRIGRAPDALVFLVIVAGVWFAWQIVCNALVLTAPPDLALRLAPDSPDALTRAAQADLEAGRNETARRLAGRALSRQPFNVQALRIAGFVADREGDNAAADRMITLAGNWSLRDSPAHSWLVRQRYQQGQSASALAHADTLMRRRVEVWPTYFDLMIALALRNDVQAQAAMVGLMRRDPHWRNSFFEHAVQKPEGVAVAAALAIALKDGPHHITPGERSLVYDGVMRIQRPDLMRKLRNDLEGAGRPVLTAGDFSSAGQPPFGWRLPSAAGVLSEIAQDVDRGQPALHALVSNLGGEIVAEQLVLLTPGRWHLSGRVHLDQGDQSSRFAWTLTCSPGSGESPAVNVPLKVTKNSTWTQFSQAIDVPAELCDAQWLRLVSLPQDRRDTAEIWIDDLTLRPVR